MTCYHPRKAWKPCSRDNPDQRPKFGDFPPDNGWSYSKITLPCNGCMGCRLAKSGDWGVRIMHEAKHHVFSSFLTLTIDEDHMNENFEICKADMQLFMHRLRKHVLRKHGIKIRYCYVGEYGDTTKRAHYHAVIFGESFVEDRREVEKSHTGCRQWESPTLNKLWGKGRCTIGDVTIQSAEYLGRHNIKKIRGEMAKDHYKYVHPVFGSVHQRIPEFFEMSRRPGIGFDHWQQNKNTLIVRDSVVVTRSKGAISTVGSGFGQMQGKKQASTREAMVPKYYDKLLKRENPEALEAIKAKRKAKAGYQKKLLAKESLPEKSQRQIDNTPERLAVREQCKKAKLELFRRKL